jgi:hypothetical protein
LRLRVVFTVTPVIRARIRIAEGVDEGLRVSGCGRLQVPPQDLIVDDSQSYINVIAGGPDSS